MYRDDKVDFRVEDGVFNASDIAGGITMWGGDVVGLTDDSGEFADVVVHGVYDVDLVAGEMQLAGEVDGDGEAAIGE